VQLAPERILFGMETMLFGRESILPVWERALSQRE
jgi:hypothetical protein